MEGSSPAALGNAFAGSAAGIHNNSDMFFNPATIRNFKDSQLTVGVTHANLDIDATAYSSSFINYGAQTGVSQASGGRSGTVPAFYYSTPLNQDWSAGVNLTFPFAARSTYPDDWLGRFHAIDTEIKATNLNPEIAWQVNDKLSVGVGLQYQRLETTVSRDTSPDSRGIYIGDDDQYGFTFGVLATPTPELKLGLGYRSALDYSLRGDVTKTSTTTGALQSVTPGQVDWTMPEMATLGAAWQADDKMEWAADMRWTRWSRVSVFRIQLLRPTGGTIEVPLPFRDSVLLSLGMNYKLNNQWLLRTGIAHEKDAVTDDMRNPRIPTGDRNWASLGLQYKINDKASLDMAYAHLFFGDTSSNFPANASRSSASLDARYGLSADMLGVSFTYAW